MADIRVSVPLVPDIPVVEINRAISEEELEDLVAESDRLEGKIVLRTLEDKLDDKGRLNLAHQLFLFGYPEGPRKGIPIRDPGKLAKATGVPRNLIEPHVRPWTKEAMRMARDSSPIYAFACSREARNIHLADLEKMRGNILEIEEALGEYPRGSRPWLELMKSLRDARKEWQEASGISSGVRISEEAAKLQAKALIESSAEEVSTVRRIDGKCFDIDEVPF